MVHVPLKLDPLLMTILFSVFFNRFVDLPVKEVDTSTNSPLDPIPSTITINSLLDPTPCKYYHYNPSYVEYVCNSITKIIVSIMFSYIDFKATFSLKTLDYMGFCYFIVTKHFRELLSMLSTSKPGEEVNVCIVGLKGVGKTFVLVELAAYYISDVFIFSIHRLFYHRRYLNIQMKQRSTFKDYVVVLLIKVR